MLWTYAIHNWTCTGLPEFPEYPSKPPLTVNIFFTSFCLIITCSQRPLPKLKTFFLFCFSRNLKLSLESFIWYFWLQNITNFILTLGGRVKFENSLICTPLFLSNLLGGGFNAFKLSSILIKKYTILKLSKWRSQFYNYILESSPDFCIIKYTSQITAFISAFILSLLSSHNRT